MAEQLSLFGEENTLFNKGVQQLLEMNFSASLETMERYGKLFPWGRDVSSLKEMITFFQGHLGQLTWTRLDPDEAERRYQIWLEFEAGFGGPWSGDAIEERLQARYFSRLIDSLAAGGYLGQTKLPAGTPFGLLYLLARKTDAAITILQDLIAIDSKNARARGYLGDAYLLYGDLRTARIYYREAFVIAPDQVDLKRIQDNELKEYLDDLREDDDHDGEVLAWFSVRAHLEGIFERRIFRDLDHLKYWLDGYLGLVEDQRKQNNARLVPQLFYYAMVLSDNAPMLEYIESIELLKIRQKMKELHPGLFSRYMSVLSGKFK